MELKICHLYPDILNLYGDSGNVTALERRLRLRGIGADTVRLRLGEHRSLAEFDIVFIGGGQDFEQELLLPDLRSGRAEEVKAAVEDGVAFLAVCGGYQMLGSYYETYDGHRCGFIGAADFYTVGAKERMIGDYAFRCGEDSGGSTVVGFENHSGRTHLGEGVKPLGAVLSGFGNNGEDGGEGVRYKNVFGTYSHGPVLPKNPEFCDFILKTALCRKYGCAELAPLDDGLERLAHDAMLRRLGCTEES